MLGSVTFHFTDTEGKKIHERHFDEQGVDTIYPRYDDGFIRVAVRRQTQLRKDVLIHSD